MLLGRLARGFAAECEQRHAVPTEHPGSKFRLVVVFHQAVKDWAVRWRLKGGDERSNGTQQLLVEPYYLVVGRRSLLGAK